jgi:hypothetical protein
MRKAAMILSLVSTFAVNGCGGGGGSGAGGSGGHGGAGTGDGGASGSTGAGGTTDVGGTTGTGGSTATCGTSTDPSVGDICNTLDATGACVTETLGTGSPPSPAGGTVGAGTYDLTSMVRYPTADGGSNMDEDRRETLRVSSVVGSAFSLEMTRVSGTSVQRQAGGVVASETQVTFTPTCPVGSDSGGTAGYSSTSTTFTLFDMNGAGELRLSTYTKR